MRALGTSQRARITAVIAAVLAVAVTASCTTAPPTGPAGKSPTPSGTAAAASTGAGGDITLAFAGDIHFTGRTAKLLDDPKTAFGPIASELSNADVTLANMETAITTRGKPEKKEYKFRAPGTAFDAFREAGIDAAVMANNHAMDYGREALADTLAEAAERDYPALGIGADAAQAYRPWVKNVRGTRIAFLAFSQLHELSKEWAATDDTSGIAYAHDRERAADLVKAAKKISDVVVVYLHAGKEGDKCPFGPQRALTEQLATAGADAVISAHAHTLVGDGWYDDTYVSYGLGNFLWWQDNAVSNDTGVAKVTIRNKKVTAGRLVPARISATGQPKVATGAEASRINSWYDGLRSCTGLSDSPGVPPSDRAPGSSPPRR